MKKHLQRLLLIAAALLAPLVTQGQTLEEYGYSTGVDTSRWITVDSPGASLIAPGAGDGSASAVVNLGFTFTLGGVPYTQFSVNTDGNLRLGPTATGTVNYSTPFSSTNASANTPKINFFGCDGYFDNNCAVYYRDTVNAAGDSVGVVDFTTTTYTTTTRGNLYRWQVQLYHSGKIVVVIGPSPTTAPAVSRQQGLCTGANDIWLVDGRHNATHYTAGVSTTVSTYYWPQEGRYYAFMAPSLTCPRPYGLTAQNVSAHSFDISWSDSSSYEWYVLLTQDGAVVDSLTTTNAYASFTGLASATHYAVRVASLCTDGDTSIFRDMTVVTGCDMVDTLPYHQNFDNDPGETTTSVATNNLPPCWDYRNRGTSTTYSGYPIVYDAATYAHSGTNSMRFYTYITSGTYDDQIALMPETDSTLLPVNSMKVGFWMRDNSTSYVSTVVVGVMTDATDEDSFVAVDTFRTGSTTYAYYETYLSGYNGPHGRVAFKAPQPTSGYNYFYIDDITLDYMPTCPPVINIGATNVSTTSADISWQEIGSAISWTVDCRPAGTGIDSVVSYYATDTTVTLTGLRGNTQYEVAIVAFCGSESSDTARFLFYTACDFITTLPYTCDFDAFEGATSTSVSTNNLPQCWQNHNTGTNTSYSGYPIIYNSSTYAHSGTNSMRFYTYITAGTYSDQIAILPPTDSIVLPINTLSLNFWMRSNTASYNSYVVVGVMTDPANASTFIPVDTLYTNASTTYAYHEVYFDRYAGPHGYIAIKAPQPTSGYNYLYIDDLALTAIPTCPQVSDIAANGISAISADISWHERGEASSWSIVYYPQSDITDLTTTTAYDTTIALTGLTPNTAYVVGIVADCGSETSDTVWHTFHTLCNAIDSLPFVYDFEGDETGSSTSTLFPSCLTRLNNGSTYYGWPYVGGSTYNHTPGGSSGLYWYNSTTTGTYSDYQIVVMPAVDTDLYPINTLEFTFWSRASSTSYNPTFTVGVMTDAHDPATFQEVVSINVGANTTWREFTVSLGTFTGTGNFIALRAVRPPTSWYAYVDDLSINEASTCPDITRISSVATAGHAKIDWAYDTLLGIAPSGFQVRYGLASDSLASPTVVTTTDTTITLTGLDAATPYTIGISVLCDGTPGIETVRTFSTRPLPCLEWDTTGSTHTGGSSPAAVYPIGTPGTTSTDVMPVNGGYTYSYCNHLVLSSEINSGAVYLSGIDLLYAGTAPMVNTTNCSIFLCHTNMTVCEDFAPVTDLQLVYEGPILCDADSGGWNHIEFNRGSFAYNGTSNLMVAIVKNGTGSETGATFHYEVTSASMTHRVYNNNTPYDYAAMAAATASNSFWRTSMRLTTGGNGGGYDCISTLSCSAPAAWVDSVVGTTAHLAWLPGYNEGSWTIQYRAASDTAWTTAGTGVGATNYTLSGLIPNTQYEVQIGSECSDTVMFSSIIFRTDCGLFTLPFIEHFDTWSSTAADPLPSCWTKHTNYTSNYPYASTSYNHTPGGSKAMYMYSTSTTWSYMVLPSFSAPIDSTQVSFWLYKSNTSYAHKLIVGVIIDPDNENTFHAHDTVIPSVSSTWEEFIVDFRNYTGPTGRIAILSPNGEYSYPYLDDLTVDYIPACPRVLDIQVSNISLTTADISWHEQGTATGWNVEYGISGFTPGTGITTYANDTSITLTGLSANTPYDVYIAPDCPAGRAGSNYTSFRTLCTAIDSLPWYDDLESYAAGASSSSSSFIPCWFHHNNGTSYGGYPYLSSSSTYNHTSGGTKGLYWYNSTTTGTYGDYQCIVLPGLDTMFQIGTLQLTFWAKASSTSYTPTFQIGVLTDPYDVTTFEGIDTITFSGTNWQFFDVPLAGYNGNGHYIALKADRPGSSWYAYVDDFGIEYGPTCITPRRIRTTESSTQSVTIDWVDPTPAASWEIEYGPIGFTRGSAAGTAITVTSHPVAIAGLDTSSSYDLYIRSICSSTDSGRWRGPFNFMTNICDGGHSFVNGNAGSSGTTYYAPVNNYYHYTLSETIIDSAELDGPMDIESIAYYYNYTSASTDKTNCTIYFQPTDKTVFSSSSDVVALDTATALKVYEGSLNCSQGWNYFQLDTVYSYNGTGNLMIIVDDNSDAYDGSSYVFRSEPCRGTKTLYYYSDSQNPDVYNPSSFTGSKATASWRTVMQLISCTGAACRMPNVTSVSQTYHSATINWLGDGSDYEVNIKESASANWPDSNIAVSANSYTFNRLRPSTYYTFRVRQNCTADSLGYSDWYTDSFITDSLPCLVPDSLHATAVTNATATLDWNVLGNETNWDIHVWFTGGLDSVYRVSSHPATVGGFTAGLTYYAAVRPLCGIDLLEGDWSDTMSFTTATCPDVTGLTASNVTTNSVTLNWTANPMAQSWTIEYGFEGFNQGSGTTVTANTNSYVVTGLLDESSYEFFVKANCGTDWTSENWVSVQATTQSGGVVCDAPTGVSTTVADNAVTVNWTPGTGNISYEIEYGPRGFSHGNGTVTNATTSPAVISNLDYETSYDLYVRAICDQNTYSAYSIVATFTTGQRPSEDCAPVSNLAVTEITDNTAHVAWTPAEGTDTWQIVVTDAQGSDVVDEVRSESYFDLAGLTAGKDYTVRVRTVCGDDNFSAYVSANFRTTGGVGIGDVNTVSCTIYPNPTTSSTTISVSGVNGKVKIEVVDMNGRVVSSDNLECSSDCVKTMDVDNLAQGAYFVRITADSVSMVRKLIVR